MSWLSTIVKKAAPIVATVAPGTPIGTAAAVASTVYAKQDADYQRKLAEDNFRKAQEMEQFGNFGTSSFRDPYASQLIPIKEQQAQAVVF